MKIKRRNDKRSTEQKNTDFAKDNNLKQCIVCGTPLFTKKGCAGTGMCGPCCTGDASTAGEY